MSGGNAQPWIDAGASLFKFTPEILGASALVPPGPLVVGKLDQQDAALNLTDWKALMRQGVTPEAAADLRFSAQTAIYVGPNKPRVNRYEANPRVDVWEDDNEVVPDNSGEAVWYADYCIEMMQRYEEIGKRRANFSFAVGTPDVNIWPHLLPAVRYARDHGHYIALHEYMGYEADYGVGWKQVDANRNPTTNVWHGRPDKVYPWGWAALRYRYIWDTVLGPAGLGDTRLLITESGCDSVESVTPAGMPVGSWKAMGLSVTAYTDMLLWYDRRVREDAYVAGAVVFTVGSVGIWANWDIADTNVETLVLEWIAAERNTSDEHEEPPPGDGDGGEPVTNVLTNPSFEDGWTDHDVYTTTQNPTGWTVEWNAGPLYENPHSEWEYQVGEGVHKSKAMLPAAERDVFVWDGDWTYKLFAGQRSFWARLKQTLTLPAGRYRLTTPVWVDCYRWAGFKDYAVEPWQAETMVKAGGRTVKEWSLMVSGTRAQPVTVFDHAGGPVDLAVHFRCNWPISNNLWLDGWSLVAVAETEPPPVDPPPPAKHKAIVLKVPQNVTAAEWLEAAEFGYQYRHTMTASHDDMLTILRGGNADSYVKLAYPERQQDVAALIEAAGYAWQPVLADPLAGVEFGHPFAWRYVTTSGFNTARSYGPHEGVDYDIVGGAANNTVGVLCVFPGIVERSSDAATGYGKQVRVKHVTPSGVLFFTRYAHLDARYVEVGQAIARGEAVGEIGATGNVTGEHLHLNIEIPGYGLPGYVTADVIDPTEYVPSGADLPLYSTAFVDLLPYLRGDGRVYRLSYLINGQTGQQTLQTQQRNGRFYHVKSGEYEELWNDANFIYRGIDTSPGDGLYYVQRQDVLIYGARWCPRYWTVGAVYERNPLVTFYRKSDCKKVDDPAEGYRRTWLRFAAKHAVWNGVADVIELHWLPKLDGPVAEKYWYGLGRGLVGWEGGAGRSWWIGDGGTAPVMEIIGCLS